MDKDERNLADNSPEYYELVFLFRKGEIAVELQYASFVALLNDANRLEQFASEKIQCVYAAVSSRLALRGAVCFELQFDESGRVDDDFGVPLRHLMESAGIGPDLGAGRIKLACRSQCSISWQAMNLWEPKGGDNKNPLNLVQRALWRNRLGLIIRNELADAGGYQDSALPQLDLRECDTKIDDAFDNEGRVSLQELIKQHKSQLEQLKTKFRVELERQQNQYLEQIKKTKDEQQQLKVALRMEQQRSLRLQQILRGEPNH
ncbi:MAG: hypothetical protein KUG75_09455 [Pseudomonadales bacterium]|nr:hypothetical protein [Pseudomonadales bacterium]